MKQTIENDERCSANPTSANDGMNEGRKATLGVGLVALVWTGDLGSLVRLPILPADLRTPDRRSAFGDRLALQMQNADVYPLNVWLFLISEMVLEVRIGLALNLDVNLDRSRYG